MTNYVDNGAGLFVPSDYGQGDYGTRIAEAYGSGWRSEFDAPYNRNSFAEQLGVGGVFDLREWTWSERVDVLKRCRMAWERNPVANTAVTLTTLFCVGKGLQITHQSEETKEVLEEFIKDPDNDFEGAETELLDSLQIDGELFIRIFSERGKTLIVPLEPWNIQHIKTDPIVTKRRDSYHYAANVTDGWNETNYVDEWIDAADVLHVAINRSLREVRGRSELFRILPWLKAHKDALEEMSRLIRRMSVYYHLKVQGTPSQIAAARNAYKEPPPPASFLITDKNTELNAVPSNLRAADMSEHSRNLKLMVAVGKRGMPEYMLSDGENANLATTQSQQLPALRAFAYFQDVMVERLYRPLFKRVIQNAVEAGRCPEQVTKLNTAGDAVPDDDGQDTVVDAVEAFDCAYRDLEAGDPATLAQALQLAVTMGWVSNETASIRLGYDYAAERKKIEAEQADAMMNAYATAIPPQGETGAPTEPGANVPPQGRTGKATEPQGDEGDAEAAQDDEPTDKQAAARRAGRAGRTGDKGQNG